MSGEGKEDLLVGLSWSCLAGRHVTNSQHAHGPCLVSLDAGAAPVHLWSWGCRAGNGLCLNECAGCAVCRCLQV